MTALAFNKPANQSSTFEMYYSEYAVDGNRGTDLVQDKCSHTGTYDTNPWWMVDLLTVYTIKFVRIINRGMDTYGKGRRAEQ